MNKKALTAMSLSALVVAISAAGITWGVSRQVAADPGLTLYGNVDLRQVDLAFNNSERIDAIVVQEGDRVHAGQVLARLDSQRLEPQVAESQARLEAGAQVVARLRRGSRPEEVAQARANVASAQAEVTNARQQFERLTALFDSSSGRAISKQDLDGARTALDVATARLTLAQKSLELVNAGPRKEDIAQAEAQLRGDEARLLLLRRQLADSELRSPSDAVVRSRLMEPGEIATPQRPVFSLAVVDPKWVRAYVSETELAKVRPGMPATVHADGVPKRSFTGWVGYISPVAEFTPKTVQTAELRTSLVYQIRVFIKDKDDELRLGMPATVVLSGDSRAQVPAHTGSAPGAVMPPSVAQGTQ